MAQKRKQSERDMIGAGKGLLMELLQMMKEVKHNMVYKGSFAEMRGKADMDRLADREYFSEK